jgi:outer membrane protein TolC
VDDARTAELGAKRDYINSLASFLSSLDTFKTTLGLPISEQLYLDDHDLADLTAAGLTPVDIDNKVAFSMCVSNQMEILNSIDRFEDSKRKIRIAADQLRTSLNLVGNATLSSADPYDYTNFDPNKVRYSVGLNLNLPLDRLRERNNYRATLISFESKLRQLSSTLDTYKVRIDRNIRTLEQTRLNYLNGVESLSVAKRRVENNSMLLEAGRATVRDVREAQDGLVQAENNLATIYASYLSTRLGLLIAIGALDMQPDKFWLLDPLKDRLTPDQRSAPALRMPDDKILPPQIFIDPAS